ncbi:hypothetical protein [Paenibacillus sp. A14]|uniref:hypothetical protein n=1 Tax=Paenibacillus sp. A14 TaxID=3119820 RepID=UPI002FE17056
MRNRPRKNRPRGIARAGSPRARIAHAESSAPNRLCGNARARIVRVESSAAGNAGAKARRATAGSNAGSEAG